MNSSHDNPVYIVSGFPRSGTSMMMRALEAGGLKAIYDPARDDAINRSSSVPGYVPNPHGFYESIDTSHRDRDWNDFRGCCLKFLHEQLCFLRHGFAYRSVYLLRDPREIAPSYAALFRKRRARRAALRSLHDYHRRALADIVTLGRFGDVKTLHYAEIVADPVGELSRLGWPIDVAAAAAAVDPALRRHKVEDLP